MRKQLCFLMALLCFSVFAIAQNVTVTGRVTDAKDGTPLSGVSVTSKQSKAGVKTDARGAFSIEVGSRNVTLVFSFIGYATQEVSARGDLNIALAATDANLNEVVVVGYGTQQKKAFTGAASKVDVKEFSNLLTPSIDKQLAGRAAGVQVTTSGGLVNAPARIRIRGTQSVSQSNDPLIVVDGIPIISGNLAAATNSNTLGDINPADIENLEILKDGSATAIYGSRAAGGVILITTKKGTKGRVRVNYDGFVGFSNPLKKFSVLNAQQFETIVNEKYINAGLTPLAGVNTAVDTANTDWQKQVMISNALSQSHTISLQGGSDKTTYYLSANFSRQQGVIISNYNRAYRIRTSIDHELNKFVKLGNSITLSRQEDGDQNNGTNSLGGAIASALRLLPNVSPYSPTGYQGWNINYPSSNTMQLGPNNKTVDDNFYNVAYTLRANKYYSDKYRIIDNAYLEVSPIKTLKLRSQVGVDMLNDYSYQGLVPFHGDGYGTSSVYNADQNFLRLVWSNYFNYNLSVGQHNFFLTGGNEVQRTTTKYLSASGSNISDPFYVRENVISNSASTQSIGGSYDQTGFLSLFGRFNYDYGNRYFVQATFRRDGQSALAPGKKYGTFPGFSAGWRPSQEGFWRKSAFLTKWFSEVKLKGSYGKVGNPLGGYPYLSTFGNTPYGNLSGIGATGVGNPDLRWETSAKYDAGIELGLLRNRINVTVDWFLNNNDNLVLNVPTPLSAGIAGSTDFSGGKIAQNVGRLQNRGIEISVNASVIRTRTFSWDVTANYSYVKNKLSSLYSLGGVDVTTYDDGIYNLNRVGDPVHIIYGYDYAGVNPYNGNPMWYKHDAVTGNRTDLIQLNLTRGTGTVGAYYLASKDAGTLGTQSSLATSDKINLGQGVPTYFGALINNFSYKNFSLEVMFRYSGGNKIMNVTRQDALLNMSFQNNGTEILDRWTTVGQVTDVPKVYYGQAANMNSSSNSTSRFVESGNYIRLQNIVLSYTLGNQFFSKFTNGYVKSARLYLQGQNLHVWTKYTGADPDNISALGVDNAVSPQVRTFSAGLSVGF